MTPRAPGWVYLVSDRRRLLPAARTTAEELAALEAQCEDAMAAGVDVIQLREPDLEADRLRAFAARVAARAGRASTRVVVNDRADVAHAARAHGVHLKGDGPAAERVRSLLPRGSLVGRSVHSVDEVRHHQAADYLLFGSVFSTASKPGVPARGVGALREAAGASRVPVIAIGGLDASRATACVEAGAAGLAGIGLFLPEGRADGALGPARAIAVLRAALAARTAS